MQKLSILTTYYNAGKSIEKTLQSVLNQKITFDDNLLVEYILINDCSTDNSAEIVENFLAGHNNPYIYCINTKTSEHRGENNAYNFGIKNYITGDYVMFLNMNDDFINNDFIIRAINDLKENGSDVIEYGYMDNTGDKPNQVISDKDFMTESSYYIEILLMQNKNITFNTWSKIYKIDIIKSYPYNDNNEFSEILTIPLWLSSCNKITVKSSAEINVNSKKEHDENDINYHINYVTALSQLFNVFSKYPEILKNIYIRALSNITAIMYNHTSDDPGFNEMNKLNRYMLSYIMPDKYDKVTYINK